MTIIFIENEVGSGQIVTVAETFKKQSIKLNLRPGESGRFLMSPFKSIVVSECIIAANGQDNDEPIASLLEYAPYVPIRMTMHINDD